MKRAVSLTPPETEGPKFPRKRLYVRGDPKNAEHSEDFEVALEELKARIRANKERLRGGNLDAPDMTEMIYLGKMSDAQVPIFKINVPGWIYRYSPYWSNDTTSNYGREYSQGRSAIMLSYDPNYLASNSEEAKNNRIMYMTAGNEYYKDGVLKASCFNANAMFPINPGSDTYMYIKHDTRVTANSDVNKEYYFVPTVLAGCLNIHKEDYVTKVGTTNVDLPLEDAQSTYIDNQILKKIFNGKFSDLDGRGHMKNFAAVRGWMRVRRDKVIFLSSITAANKSAWELTHPESQLENDEYVDEDFWRYGILLCRLKHTDDSSGTSIKSLARMSHSSEPWYNSSVYFNTAQRVITQSVFTTTDKYKKFTSENLVVSPDKLFAPGIYKGYTIGYYFRMYMEQNDLHTMRYVFAGTAYSSLVMAINGEVFDQYGSSRTSTKTFIPPETGWYDITIIHHSLSTHEESGCKLIWHQYNGSATIRSNMTFTNTTELQLFVVPKTFTVAKYRSLNKYFTQKQLLVS